MSEYTLTGTVLASLNFRGNIYHIWSCYSYPHIRKLIIRLSDQWWVRQVVPSPWRWLHGKEQVKESFLRGEEVWDHMLERKDESIRVRGNRYNTQVFSFSFVSKTSKKKYCTLMIYVESRKRHRWTYLQSRNRDTDVENKHMDTKKGKGWNELGGIDIYTLLIVVVQSLGHIQLFSTPWTAAC